MSTVIRVVVALYCQLLRLYPAGFRVEFADEMEVVFKAALGDAGRRGRLFALIWCGREFTDLLTVLVQEHWWDIRREEPAMGHLLPFDRTEDVDKTRRETPWAIIAGILPFLLSGLMYVIQALYYPEPLPWLRHNLYFDLAIHAILLVGLGLGWALRFPRWSFAYLGIVVMSSIWLAGIRTVGLHLFGYTFGSELWGWRGWIPLLALAVALLIITRSLRPLAQLVRGIRRDWTQLSFSLYAAVTWLFMLVTFDGYGWYNDGRYLVLNLFLLTLVISGGAYFYMLKSRPWPRVLALQGALILYVPITVLLAFLDGHSGLVPPSSTAIGWLLYLLLLSLWLSPPLWPGVVRLVQARFQAA